MNREERIEDNQFYHVYNRGNDRDPIFGDGSDYYAFLEKMKSLAVQHLVAIPIYTLMPNHYHLIVLQNPGGNLSKMMGALATSAAKRYNLKYGHIGHLFQGPFRYKPVPEGLLWYVACYIHLNPLRAGLAREPAEWKFSNFGAYVEGALVEGFLRQGENQGEGNLLPGVWEGYASYVAEVLKDERMQEEWERKMRLHVKGFLEEGYLLSGEKPRRR